MNEFGPYKRGGPESASGVGRQLGNEPFSLEGDLLDFELSRLRIPVEPFEEFVATQNGLVDFVSRGR